MKLGQMILGKTLFGMVMKQTFYGHFVAGEDQERIKPTISRMQSFGVKSILDYSVEVDESESKEDKKQFKKVRQILHPLQLMVICAIAPPLSGQLPNLYFDCFSYA